MKKNITLFLMLFMMLHTITAQEVATAKTGVFNNEKQSRTELKQQPIDLSRFVNQPRQKSIQANPILISESFEEGVFPPYGWEISAGTSTPKSNWTSLYDPRYVIAQDGNILAIFNCYNNPAGQDGRLITPAFLPTAGDATFSFYFNYFLLDGNFGNSDRLYVDVFDVETNAWTTSTENIISGQHGAGWIQKSIDLTNYLGKDFTGKTVRMRFRAVSAYGSYCIGIDNVTGPKRLVPSTNLIVSSLNTSYGKLPKGLLPTNFGLEANVQNVGTELTDATDLKFTVKTSTNMEIYTALSPIKVPMDFLKEETISSVPDWNTASVTTGNYILGYEALHSESNINDRTDNFPLEITDYLYARDIGTIQPTGVGATGGTITMGLPYEITSPQVFSGVQIHWTTFTATANIGFKVALYTINSNFQVQSTVFESEELYKTPDMSNKVVNYYVKPQDLNPGIYVLALKQTGTTNIGIGYDATAYGYTCIANNDATPTTFNPNFSFGSIALRMDLTPKQTAIFTVTNGSDPLPNAAVTVKKGNEIVASIPTNATGTSEFWVEKGNYTYSVVLDGYIPINNIPFTVADDINIPVTLQEATLDATIIGITSPTGNIYSGTHDIKVTLKNAGLNTITALSIDYNVNGTTASYNWTGSLARNEEAEVTVAQNYNFNQHGENVIIATSKLTGDLVPENNAFTSKVNVFNFTIPFAENFDGVTAPAFPLFWSIENTNNDAKRWVNFSGASYSSPNSALVEYNGTLDTDDWLFTPQIEMKRGKTYKVEFYCASYSSQYAERLKVHIGTSPTSAGMNASPIIDLNSIQTGYFFSVDEIFTVEADGKYHIGFHGYSEKDKYALLIDDVVITEVLDNDISLEGISLRHLHSPVDEIAVIAGIKNVGLNNASCNVTLEVKDAGEQVVKTLTLPASDLSYKQTATLPFEVFSLPAGMYTATVTAIWSNDQNTENNSTTKTFQVLPDHIIGYDDFVNYNAIGAGATIYDMAIKFLPEDMVSMNLFGKGTITHISAYINQPVNAHTLKIWQGENAETEVFSQDFTPAESSWNVIALDEPYKIDPTKELWIGFRFDGIDNTFPIGVDMAVNHNMKSNLYRTPFSESNPAWRTFTNGDINLQLVSLMDHFDLTVDAMPFGNGLVNGEESLTLDVYEGMNIDLNATASEGYILSYWLDSNGKMVSKANPLSYIVEKGTTGLTANFDNSHNVTFNITDQNHNPVSGAKVTFNGTEYAEDEYTIKAAPGTHEYSVTKNGYTVSSGKVNIVENDITENVSISITHTVTFTVLDAGSSSITDAVIYMNDMVNETGNYLFHLPAGTYTYVVKKTGFISATGSITVDNVDLTQGVTLTAGTDPEYTVAFNVIDDNNNAITGFNFAFGGVVMGKGETVVPNVPVGVYKYLMEKEGYMPGEGSVIVTGDVTETVRMKNLYEVSFSVKDKKGADIENAAIIFDGISYAPNAYTIKAAAGSYPYTVIKQGYVTSTGQVEIENGNKTENIVLALITYDVTFNVTDNDEAPLTGAVINLGNQAYPAGQYKIEDVEPGTYNYNITLDKYQTASGEITVIKRDITTTVKLQKDRTGTEEILSSGLMAYPNPFRDKIYINSSSVEKVTVTNITGQKMKEVKVKNVTSFSTSDLSSGYYILTFEDASGDKTTVKMSKE